SRSTAVANSPPPSAKLNSKSVSSHFQSMFSACRPRLDEPDLDPRAPVHFPTRSIAPTLPARQPEFPLKPGFARAPTMDRWVPRQNPRINIAASCPALLVGPIPD